MGHGKNQPQSGGKEMISIKKLSENPVQERLRRAIGEVEKRVGAGALMTFDGRGREAVEVISTGSFALDRALGVGGLPRGRDLRS
jgi:RecA/RadA recombinase